MKILFVAANPLDTGRLALDEEIRAIQRKIGGSPHREEMELIAIWAARPDDLLQAINEHEPTIIHFVGHASSAGLHVTGEDRQAHPVTGEALLRLLALKSAASVRVVILNACYSSELAAGIERIVGCAIGMTGRWGDETASIFSSSFFRAIGFGATIREAVEQGCTSILLEGANGADDVQVYCSTGIGNKRIFPKLEPRRGTRSSAPARERISIPLLNEVEATEYVEECLAGLTEASLAFMDIDGVLGINTVYGNHIGDLVIDRCCEIVAHQARGRGACRIRGDQFLLLDTSLYHQDSLHSITTTLLQDIQSQDWSALAHDLHVSVTGVIAHWAEYEDAASLLLRAILGVKEAKKRPLRRVPVVRNAILGRSFEGSFIMSRGYIMQQISGNLS